MAILSNSQIRKAIDQGQIVCHPLESKHIGRTSLDITMGYYYYRIGEIQDQAIYNPFDKEAVERYFDGPYKALTHSEWCALNGFKQVTNIPPNHPVISLRPHERILAHSHEFIGILPPGMCQVGSRSSWERNGIVVSCASSWVEPGSINRLTLTITNLNDHKTVLLPVGERFAQVLFHETGEVEGHYGDGRSQGFSDKYQQGTDLETIIKTWSPDNMLPMAYKDVRRLPTKIEGLPYE